MTLNKNISEKEKKRIIEEALNGKKSLCISPVEIIQKSLEYQASIKNKENLIKK